jgi:hypothetical protein
MEGGGLHTAQVHKFCQVLEVLDQVMDTTGVRGMVAKVSKLLDRAMDTLDADSVRNAVRLEDTTQGTIPIRL